MAEIPLRTSAGVSAEHFHCRASEKRRFGSESPPACWAERRACCRAPAELSEASLARGSFPTWQPRLPREAERARAKQRLWLDESSGAVCSRSPQCGGAGVGLRKSVGNRCEIVSLISPPGAGLCGRLQQLPGAGEVGTSRGARGWRGDPGPLLGSAATHPTSEATWTGYCEMKSSLRASVSLCLAQSLRGRGRFVPAGCRGAQSPQTSSTRDKTSCPGWQGCASRPCPAPGRRKACNEAGLLSSPHTSRHVAGVLFFFFQNADPRKPSASRELYHTHSK